MGWWKEEISRRTAPEPFLPPPTKTDMRNEKIERVKNNITRYEKKIRFYTNKLKKAQRSLKMLERFQRLSTEPKIDT
jgi:hypothetical protein